MLCSAASTPALVSIFNGKDLTGWKVKGPELWRAENGVLIGQSNEKKVGGLIETEKKYRDFVIELDVKYIPPGDSGVVFRTPGLQMQIGTSHSLEIELTGSFYLGKEAYPERSTAKDTWRYFKPGAWNTLRLEARGSTFDVSVNGHHVLTYSDDKHPEAGPINLQVHNSMDMKVEFKNIRVAEL